MGMLVGLGAWHSLAAARVWHGERSDPSGGPLSQCVALIRQGTPVTHTRGHPKIPGRPEGWGWSPDTGTLPCSAAGDPGDYIVVMGPCFLPMNNEQPGMVPKGACLLPPTLHLDGLGPGVSPGEPRSRAHVWEGSFLRSPMFGNPKALPQE